MKNKSKILLLFLLLCPCIIHSQSDSVKYFTQKDLMDVKEWRGIGYFLVGDSAVGELRSCRNEGEICKYTFFLVKFNYTDSTLHLIGEGRKARDMKPFDLFNIYIGKIVDHKYLSSSYKFVNIKYSVFDIIIKVNPKDKIFVNIGDGFIDDDILIYTMDSFNISSLVFKDK